MLEERKPFLGETVLYWRAEDDVPQPLIVTSVHREGIDGGTLCLKAGWESRLNVQYGPNKQFHYGFATPDA